MPAQAPNTATVDPAGAPVNHTANGEGEPASSEFEQLTTYRRPTSRIPASVTFLGNTVQSAARFSKIIFESGNAGKGIPNAQTVFLKIMRGLELGMGPMESLAELHLIDGRATCSARLLLKKAREAGIKHRWIESTSAIAHLEFTTPDGEIFEETFTIEEAEQGGLMKEVRWQRWPKAMLRARCLSRMVNGNVPEVVGGGMLLAEELGADVDAAGNIMALPAEPVRAPRPAAKAAAAPAPAAQVSELDRAAGEGDEDGAGDVLGGAAVATGTPDAPAPEPAEPPAAAHRPVARQSTAAPGMVSMIRKTAIDAGLWNAKEATVCLAGQIAATVGLEADWYTPTYLAEQVNAEEIVRELQAIATERKERARDDDDNGNDPQSTLNI